MSEGEIEVTQTVATSIMISIIDLTKILRERFKMPDGEIVYGPDGYDFPITFIETKTTKGVQS